MLISRETFGVTLHTPLESWSAAEARLVEQAAEAGAGAASARWSGGDLHRTVERISGFPLVADCASEVASAVSLPDFDGRVMFITRLDLSAGKPPTAAPFAAIAAHIHGGADMLDPRSMEAGLRSLAASLREQAIDLPIWIAEFAPPDVEEERQVAWLIQFAAHALALGIARVFFRLPEAAPAPTLRALSTMTAWLDGAVRITWLARGQYRAEFAERPNRYLLWRDPALKRLPSSLQGPLSVHDTRGEQQRIETSRLRLTEQPVLVERKGE